MATEQSAHIITTQVGPHRGSSGKGPSPPLGTRRAAPRQRATWPTFRRAEAVFEVCAWTPGLTRQSLPRQCDDGSAPSLSRVGIRGSASERKVITSRGPRLPPTPPSPPPLTPCCALWRPGAGLNAARNT